MPPPTQEKCLFDSGISWLRFPVLINSSDVWFFLQVCAGAYECPVFRSWTKLISGLYYLGLLDKVNLLFSIMLLTIWTVILLLGYLNNYTVTRLPGQGGEVISGFTYRVEREKIGTPNS